MAIDLEVIADNLAELLTSVVNTTAKFYDIFLNPVPKDVEVQVFDDDNKLVTISIPNRAKDRQIALTGIEDPEGSISAYIGAIYVNTLDETTFVKAVGNGTNTGWEKIATLSDLRELNKEPLYQLNGSGSVTPIADTSYFCVTSGNLSITLPSVVLNANSYVEHRIHIQLYKSNAGHTISLGTSNFYSNAYNDAKIKATALEDVAGDPVALKGYYTLDYIYDVNARAWMVEIKRSSLSV